MPNHVTHYMQFYGAPEDLEALREAVKGKEAPFEFDRIIPMPRVLKGTVSGTSPEYGELIMQGKPLPAEFDILARTRFIKDAQNSRAAKRETGYANWYEWCVNNWGTKWDAYSVSEHEESDASWRVQFDTAWSVPEPVLREIAKRFPRVDFSGHAVDEGDCFTATFSHRDQEFLITYFEPCKKEVA